MNEGGYRLRLQINIEQLDPSGRVQYPGGMALTQDVVMNASNFLEIAHTLGRFYELAKEIQDGQA